MHFKAFELIYKNFKFVEGRDLRGGISLNLVGHIIDLNKLKLSSIRFHSVQLFFRICYTLSNENPQNKVKTSNFRIFKTFHDTSSFRFFRVLVHFMK